jgi:hypothetical protein
MSSRWDKLERGRWGMKNRCWDAKSMRAYQVLERLRLRLVAEASARGILVHGRSGSSATAVENSDWKGYEQEEKLCQKAGAVLAGEKAGVLRW